MNLSLQFKYDGFQFKGKNFGPEMLVIIRNFKMKYDAWILHGEKPLFATSSC